jgi:hypothetical protein
MAKDPLARSLEDMNDLTLARVAKVQADTQAPLALVQRVAAAVSIEELDGVSLEEWHANASAAMLHDLMLAAEDEHPRRAAAMQELLDASDERDEE